jgi:hypothetical protein
VILLQQSHPNSAFLLLHLKYEEVVREYDIALFYSFISGVYKFYLEMALQSYCLQDK